MLSTNDLYKEINAIEDVVNSITDDYKKASLKAQVLQLKLLQNIRTNQTLIMEFQGVAKVKPVKKDEPVK